MPEDLMRYDLLAQNALLGVVRDALRHAESHGLPGEHHFFIQFYTKFQGVNIGSRLAAKYPREMTIVLQHQFHGLKVLNDHFEVELSFDNIPEKLVIPFAAVKGFLDPAVQFGLQFEVAAPEDDTLPKVEVEKTDVKPVPPTDEGASMENKPNVVSLDAFRKK